jgi:hypothetical protein
LSGESPNLQADPQGVTRYAAAWDGFIDIPADGGYTFHLLARDGARLVIDGVELAKTGPHFPQVCGAAGNAMRYDQGSLGLRAGKHTLHLEGLHSASEGAPRLRAGKHTLHLEGLSASEGAPRLLWEGPALPLTDVPAAAFSHVGQDAVTR